VLTTLQIEEFMREGVLRLENLFPTQDVARWQREIFDLFHHPTDEEAWRKAVVTYKSGNLRLTDGPSPVTHPIMREVYRDLHIGANWIGKAELRVRAPDIDVPWTGARTPHLDFPMFGSIRTLANNMVYLSEVTDRGGAFMYWPGSHRIAWDHFTRYPEDYRAQGERGSEEIFELLCREMTREPVQFLGGPGDTLIWHSLTLHSASVNLSSVGRLALIGRWGTPLEGRSHFDFTRDMWAEWDFGQVTAAAEER
jgi:hypothetical protein